MADKKFKTYDELLDLLESRGIKIEKGPQRSNAKKILQHEGYYNLINGYKAPFLTSSSPEQYIQNTTVEEIFALYQFDRSIREIFLRSILHVETNTKNLISHRFSEQYGHDNYLIYKNFDTSLRDASKNISALIASVQSQISAHAMDPNISHYLKNHGYIPLWVLNGILTFGNMSKFYSLMKQPDRQNVAAVFRIPDHMMVNFLNYLTAIRNFSAHGNRLYCFKGANPLIDTPAHGKMNIPKVNDQYQNGRNDLFAAVIVLRYLLSGSEFTQFINELNGAINKLSANLHVITANNILEIMGFPPNWKDIKSSSIK